MDTHPHSDSDSEDSASDRLYLAYGRKVKELLRLAVRAKVMPRLGLKIFGICTPRRVGWFHRPAQGLFSQEAGYDLRSHNRFVSFKELVFFFQDVGKMKP